LHLANENQKVNRLSKEKSPYLKQHQHNPVDWFAWGEEAFQKAITENKPIFLSVGYSTCHWCHVMEHESFSDPEVAKLMNDVFVCIKVDREERPDVDHIYMTVCQMLTGSGGWPLTVLMTPERKPFFAGTYFPKESRQNKPGIKDIIIRTKEVWEKFRNDITEQAEEITAQLNSVNYKAGVDTVNQGVFRKAFYELASNYDELNGGFGNRPKFPIPHNFMFLLRYGKRSNSPEAIEMVAKTLSSMRRGGIWDHVGNGFHRYSTDSEWLVPHFEKMLYDEALLAIAYTEAYQVTGEEIFKHTAKEILEYICRDLQAAEGGFYSAEDADSEGEEGKFYLWNINEIRELLIGDVEFFCDVFNIKEKGNYFDEVLGKMTGNNILHRTKSIAQISLDYGISTEDAEIRINKSLGKLFDRRKSRIRPQLDNKILTDWNGLVVTALTKAASAFGEENYAETANRTIDFIKSNMINNDFTLLHRYAEDEAGIDGMVDDYAYILLGLLEFYEYTKENEYLELSENIAKKFIELFADSDGGFFFTSSQAEKLISRKKEIYDGAMPAGNSVMLDVLLKLYSYTHNSYYYDLSETMVKTFATAINNVPSAYTYLLCGLDRYFNGTIDLVFAGNDEVDDIISEIRRKFNPNVNILNLSNHNDRSNLPEYLQNIPNPDSGTICYVCSGTKCDEPISGKENIRQILKEKFGVM
jgi:uncharacterized protein YyaL (SSP411 family)